MTDIAALKEEIRQITGLVDAARRLVADGRMVELGRLEPRVEACCTRIRALPRAAAEEVRPVLMALLDEFGRLEQKMRKSQAEIAGQLGQAGMRRRAVTAYGTAYGATYGAGRGDR